MHISSVIILISVVSFVSPNIHAQEIGKETGAVTKTGPITVTDPAWITEMKKQKEESLNLIQPNNKTPYPLSNNLSIGNNQALPFPASQNTPIARLPNKINPVLAALPPQISPTIPKSSTNKVDAVKSKFLDFNTGTLDFYTIWGQEKTAAAFKNFNESIDLK